MIRVEGGFYRHGDFTLAMDFEVPKGELVAVLGPSGAGKSTLLNVLAGFEGLERGRVVLAGADVTAAPPIERPVSFVFQDNNTFAHLSARKNVALGVSPTLKLSEADWQQVDDALAQTGISTLAPRLPGEMSGGERQRIALARVLVRKRPILMLDEAFAALGPGLRREMLQLVKKLQHQNGLTVMMVTHQPEDAAAVADQVIFVSSGVARAPVPKAAFFAASDDPQIAGYLGA